MRWMKTFETGMKCIDEQHQHLFFLLVELDSLVEAGKLDAVDLLLDEMVRCLRYHFATESDLMEIYGYPQRQRHIAEHDTFLRHLADMRVRRESLSAVRMYLYRWFTSHSTYEDRFLATHVQQARELARGTDRVAAA